MKAVSEKIKNQLEKFKCEVELERSQTQKNYLI